MITFCTPIFLLAFSKSKFGKIISLIIIAAAIILNFNYFKTSEYLGREDSYYLNRYIPTSTVSDEYKKTSEEYLRLPKDTLIRPDKIFPRALADVPAIKQINEVNALNATINVDYPESFTLNYNKYYYPGWFAKIDGEYVEITPGKPYGQITLLVSPGRHIIEIGYRESPVRLTFDLVSLAGIGMAAFLILKKIK